MSKRFRASVFVIASFFSLSALAESSTHNTTPAPDAVCVPPEPGDGIAVTRSKYRCEIETWMPMVQMALESTQTPEEEQAKILNQLRRDIGKNTKT